MIKQNGYLENLFSNTWTEHAKWIRLSCFQGSHFVCVVGWEWCVLMYPWYDNEVCMEVTWCRDGCVGVGWGCVCGVWGGWVSEFWTNGIVYMLILTKGMSTVCLTQFGQKVDWMSFGRTLFSFMLTVNNVRSMRHAIIKQETRQKKLSLQIIIACSKYPLLVNMPWPSDTYTV